MSTPVGVQMKILKQYEGQPIRKAMYALEVADGYYECQRLYHIARKTLKEIK